MFAKRATTLEINGARWRTRSPLTFIESFLLLVLVCPRFLHFFRFCTGYFRPRGREPCRTTKPNSRSVNVARVVLSHSHASSPRRTTNDLAAVSGSGFCGRFGLVHCTCTWEQRIASRHLAVVAWRSVRNRSGLRCEHTHHDRTYVDRYSLPEL